MTELEEIRADIAGLTAAVVALASVSPDLESVLKRLNAVEKNFREKSVGTENLRFADRAFDDLRQAFEELLRVKAAS
ncbi:hypothetical protein [Pandoraea commovens]|uniref:Uncharacterized protein n=1 Tax=Pandoraea commovens TaxID=2508289 RepID=A0A5E4SHV4_9BURK|nr:hypothetical protein [Pandoraea commovens]VVD74855.1 hypothetical protein PCO31010_00820 [Pandoraea commovens]